MNVLCSCYQDGSIGFWLIALRRSWNMCVEQPDRTRKIPPWSWYAGPLQSRPAAHDLVCAWICVALFCLEFRSAFSSLHQETSMHLPRCQNYQRPERFKHSFASVQMMQDIRSHTFRLLLQYVTGHRVKRPQRKRYMPPHGVLVSRPFHRISPFQ